MNASILEALDNSLSEFIPKPPTGVEMLGKVKAKPRRATVNACAELAKITSMAELKQARGYMSAATYRVFAQCGGRRR